MPGRKRFAAAGAEVVVGDLLDLHTVTAALEHVDSAYFCYPIEPGLLQATAIFAEAASEAGVSSVVNMSQICARPEAGSESAREHWLAERLLNRTPMLTAHLRPTLFAEWLARAGSSQVTVRVLEESGAVASLMSSPLTSRYRVVRIMN